jgi:catechol 2,3-dioxygenase-like lactoylglutathione lyase family enzyme
MHLDHVTIRTRNLAATRAFFIEVFGLEERPRPQAIQRIPGHWLYAGDAPIVHLIGSRGPNTGIGPEAWDHVAFRLNDYARFRASLAQKGIRYSTMDLPELNERRLFFRAPCGPLIETVFRGNACLTGEEND